MSQDTIIFIAIVLVAVLLLLLFLLRGRKQHVSFGDAARVAPPPPAAKRMVEPVRQAPPVDLHRAGRAPEEGHGVGSEVTAAIEDVIDQFVGIDAHPSGSENARGPGDSLTLLKGLGPKAASVLDSLGVTTFEQIAAWDDGDVDAIDAQMGAFKGRIRRDRWVEQARLLAKGDEAGFEAQFGKLGG